MVPGPLWLLAELTYACPLQCPYCSNPLAFNQGDDELDTDTWLRVFGEARALGAVQLGLSGGEPCVRKDLEELISGGRELGFYTNLITSAVGLDPARIERLRERGLDHIQISFQAGEATLNDKIAGTKAFDHKVAMAREVKANGFGMVLNFVLYRDNIHQVSQILELAESLGADQVELANTQYYGWAYENRSRLMPTREQLEAAEAAVGVFRKTSAMKVIFVIPDYYADRPKACMNGWGRTFLSIAPDGTALPCQAAQQLPGLTFPNVRSRSVESIWRQSDAFERFRGEEWMREPCRSCDERDKDFGGCRCQAYLLTGDPANADPVCTLSPHRALIDEALAEVKGNSVNVSLDDLVFRNTRNARAIGKT
ncbi:MAG: pyrroloquinoline quinone biosynthesis protein PqqE [Gammaproteobacteria bacterium]|nr:pyrroloquinoline quinone biosynthesis protein PqqE [Gammaproteobacteria bacterium]